MNDFNNKAVDFNADDTLPIILNKKTFADFILNFLGKKEKLSYRKKSNFLIRLNDIEQFYKLFNAKIAKEQNVFIEHFSVTFDYNDDTSRTIHGIESLKAFNETRDVLSRSVSMYWNVIMKYPNAETLENQTIECSFIKSNDGEDEIILVINHTNQAWGIEVSNLFKDKIAQLIIKESDKYSFFKSIYGYFGSPDSILINFFIKSISLVFITAVAVIAMSLIGVFSDGYKHNTAYHESKFKADLLEYYKDTGDKEGTVFGFYILNNIQASDIKKIEFSSTKLNNAILSVVEKTEKEKNDASESVKNIFISASFIITSLLMIYVFFSFYCKKAIVFYGNKSFVLMNNRSEKEYDEYNNSKNKTNFYTLTGFFIAAFSGVFGNIIYSFFW